MQKYVEFLCLGVWDILLHFTPNPTTNIKFMYPPLPLKEQDFLCISLDEIDKDQMFFFPELT